MAKSKKQDNAKAEESLIMEVMPGADVVSEEEAKPFEVDLNFDEVPEEEAKDEEVEQEVDAVGQDGQCRGLIRIVILVCIESVGHQISRDGQACGVRDQRDFRLSKQRIPVAVLVRRIDG